MAVTPLIVSNTGKIDQPLSWCATIIDPAGTSGVIVAPKVGFITVVEGWIFNGKGDAMATGAFNIYQHELVASDATVTSFARIYSFGSPALGAAVSNSALTAYQDNLRIRVGYLSYLSWTVSAFLQKWSKSSLTLWGHFEPQAKTGSHTHRFQPST